MSEGAWIRIGDLARELDVPHHVLRYWQTEFAIHREVKRMRGGSRVYPPHVADLFREVHRLLRVEFFTIAGAKRQLRLAAERLKAG
jgi:DNA-binding transcriptional MerR regulator